jgi:tRNA pseudouridine55 synthase
MFGVLNLYKPRGMTSHDVIYKVRKALNLKKVGHLGTLDPMATGVLPVCVGAATRLIEYFYDDKAYTGTITFGQTTDSWDADGAPLITKDASSITQADLMALLPQLTGHITQTIPLRSAKHIKGKKLYQYAIEGKSIELPTKQVTVHELTLLSFTPGPQAQAVIHVSCSTGTYIRSIAVALGELLGVGAHLSGLVRTRHGRFGVEESTPLEVFQASEAPQHYLQSPLPYLALTPLPALTPEAYAAIGFGQKIEMNALPRNASCSVVLDAAPNDTLTTAADAAITSKTMTDASAVALRLKTNHLYLAIKDDAPFAVLRAENTDRLKPLKVFPAL